MLISYVEKYGRSKQKITLADGDSFIISEKDWKAFGAEAGEDLDDGLIEKLYREYLLPKAKLRALNLLKVRDRSHKELISRLKPGWLSGDGRTAGDGLCGQLSLCG